MQHTQQRPRTRELPSLSAPVDPERFVEVTGERIVLLGREDGPFECWCWPLKLVSELRFGLRRAGQPLEMPEREVTVLPGELLFTWRGPGVQLRTEIFACRERPGLALGFALDSHEPLEIEVSFRCDFRPQWPAGLGGQLARIDRVTGAFALTEELGRWAALIGAPAASVAVDYPEQGLPEGVVRVVIPLLPGGASSVLAIATAQVEPDPLAAPPTSGDIVEARVERAIGATRELWFRLVSDLSAEREAVRAHWRAHATSALRLETPSPALDQAFAWAQIAIERAWTRVDGLGRGLVAGFGPSGAGERPGPAWFRDGDALAASRALSLCGAFAAAREVLRFAASHQRADGKLMTELSLAARMCRWFEDYPYAYAGGTTTLDFVTALELHQRFSGDAELLAELMPVAKRALEWSTQSLEADGRFGSAKGVTALDAHAGKELASEAFVQGAWIAALGAAVRLTQADGAHDPAPYRGLEERARAAFEVFWSEERGHYAWGLGADGKRRDGLSAFVAFPLARGLGERARAWAAVQALNRPELTSDWGVRRFAAGAAPHGARAADTVSPHLTNFAVLALFAHGHALAAHQVLFAQVAACDRGALGYLAGERPGAFFDAAPRGAPHHVAASAALVESVLLGLFGLEASDAERRIAFRPTLPPHWHEARASGLRVGATTLDVRFYRRREPGATVLGLELELGEGTPLQIGFAPVLPPLSKLLDGPGWLRPSGAVVPRRLHRQDGNPLTLEARVLEGPMVLLPADLPAPGAPSSAPRIVGQRLADGAVHWTFAGPAGSRVALPFFCDFETSVTGAQLVKGELCLEFPAGEAGEWTEVEVAVRAK